jgi:maleate isomerase
MKNFEQIDINPHLIDLPNPRVGVIALSTDFTIEQDYRRICHKLPLDIFVNRIPFKNPCTHKNYLKMTNHLPEIVEEILPQQKIDTIAYGCTSGTIAIGKDRVESLIRKSKPEAYVTTPITAALKAFKKLKINNIAVLAPYPRLVNETVFDYLESKLIKVDNFSSFNLENDADIAKVDPKHLINTIKSINYKNVDAVFVSCTALRILEVLEGAENIIKKPIISSNQAIIWDCIRSVGIKSSIAGFGKLLLN